MHSSPRPSPSLLVLAATVGLAFFASLEAQGRTDYFNVESPQGKPIDVCQIGEKTYILACNTPDNSLEIYDTDEEIPLHDRFLARVGVDLEPVTVRCNADRFYTANFLGDSVSMGRLEQVGQVLTATIEVTRGTGDEPVDLAFGDVGGVPSLFVAQNSWSGIGIFDAVTLRPRFPDGEESGSSFRVDLVTSQAPFLGLKEPRALEVRDGRLYVLGFKGGVTAPASLYDLDILTAEVGAGLPLFDNSLARLGSTNFNMRFASNGDLYIVGGEARNFQNDNGIEVRSEATGFVQSTLYRVAVPVTGSSTIYRRNLNLGRDGTTILAKPESLAMPTDLALYEVDGMVRKVFVTAFGSDSLGVLEPVTDAASQPNIARWKRGKIEYTTAWPVGGKARWGPRGLALLDAPQGPRLYVLNRIDNSVSIFDPVTEKELVSFPLQTDPSPEWIQAGRPFLYDADLSGSGFVSCASCHTEGRTDGLSWRLGNPDEIPPLGPATNWLDILAILGAPGQIKDVVFVLRMLSNATFDPIPPDDKREMVTQSLEGLLNFEVPPQTKRYFQDAPYHWRGDKKDFLQFNEAFVTLMLGEDVTQIPGNPCGDPLDQGPKGLCEDEMKAFEEFVFSILTPPNPQQPPTRTYSGGRVGGQVGLELYHIRAINGALGGRSCVHCHTLPEGSNNRITLVSDKLGSIPGFVREKNNQPLESAKLRGLFQKEALLEKSADEDETAPRIGHFGLNHDGRFPSINSFLDRFKPVFTSVELKAVKQFVHEFDSGAAPAVGLTQHVDFASLEDPALVKGIQLALREADLANAGLAVKGSISGMERGFYYDPSLAMFVEEPTGARFTPTQLLGLMSPGNHATWLSTPL
ncbi:MAG: YncE family protein, partial [Acidobacteriota bacterium]